MLGIESPRRLTRQRWAARISTPNPQAKIPIRHKVAKMSDVPIPSVVAMLICDQAIVDQGTGKKSLIGIFDNLNALVFPAATKMSVYAKLVDAYGKYDFLVKLVNLKDEAKIAEIKADNISIPQGIAAELVVNILGIQFSEPGKYEFQLHANGIYLHRVVLNVLKVEGDPKWQQLQNIQ